VLALYREQRSNVFGHKVAVSEDDFEEYTPDETGHKISPLIHAIIYGNFEIVRGLITCGASVNFTDELGRTPLMVAVIEVCFVLFV
jgi:ankyrin repeat protein